jgi:hypothetical protein
MRQLAIALGTAAALAFPGAATATTFCVPTFHAACPDNGTNVAQPNVETAMQSNSTDGVADRVVIDAGTFTDTGSFQTAGTDALEVVGAGRGKTFLTSSASGNIYVVDFLGARAITMRELTVTAPASFPDGQGAAVQVYNDTLENVDVESRNAGSAGVGSISAGGVVRGGRIYGSNGGSITTGVDDNGALAGAITVEGVTIEGAATGVALDAPQVTTDVRRVRIVGGGTGVLAVNGAFGTVDNTVVQSVTTAIDVHANSTASPTLTLRHATLVDTVGAGPDTALRCRVPNSNGYGSATLIVNNSIIRGYPTTYDRAAPSSPDVGDANLTIRYSNFASGGTNSGDGNVSKDTGNIYADPLFAGPEDFHLLAGSPSIDLANPAAGGALATDFDGAVRPVDGNGDGVAAADQGAYEYQPPKPPDDPGGGGGDPGGGGGDPGGGPGGDPAPDITPPLISGLAARRLSAHKGGKVSLSLSEPAAIVLTFKPSGTPTGGKKVVLSFKGVAGKNTLRVPRRKLRARRYVLSARAVDAAGNRSKAARLTLRVRR